MAGNVTPLTWSGSGFQSATADPAKGLHGAASNQSDRSASGKSENKDGDAKAQYEQKQAAMQAKRHQLWARYLQNQQKETELRNLLTKTVESGDYIEQQNIQGRLSALGTEQSLLHMDYMHSTGSQMDHSLNAFA